jgi:hypothetical protein
MPRKQPFPPESPTEPDLRNPKGGAARSGPAPKSKRSQAPTVPPKSKKGTQPPRASGPVPRERSKRTGEPGAKVDEVTADLSKDPRRDKD